MKWSGIIAVLAMVMCAATVSTGEEKGADMVIEPGCTVAIDYTLTVDGQVVDSSVGREPLVYTQGNQEMISGLEQALLGLKADDVKQVTVAPQDAYGEIDDTAELVVPKTELPPEMNVEPGMVLGMTSPEGQNMPVKVKAVDAETITLDLNHPLAGKTLEFDVKVVSVARR